MDVGLNKRSKRWKGELGTEVQSGEVQLSGKRARGGAEGSCCRADLFFGLLVCKAVGERRVQ